MVRSPVLAVLMCLLIAGAAQASISNWFCEDDGDGAIEATNLVWSDDGNSEYTLSMDCNQNWGDAINGSHIQGHFDSDGDPAVYFIQDIQNLTSFTWTDYHVRIGMQTTFTISMASTDPIWTDVTVVQPTLGTIPNDGGSGYVGTIDFVAAAGETPVAVNEWLSVGFKVSFDSAGTIGFCSEQYPTPEPMTIAVMGLGSLIMLRRKRS